MRTSLVFLIVIPFAAVAGTAGYFLAQPNTLAPKVKQLELDLVKARDEVNKLKAERDKLLITRKAEAPPASSVLVKADSPATKAAEDKKDAGSFGSAMRKMMEDPGMKDMMRKQQEMQINMAYGKLFQKLGLNDKEVDNFKQLLADRAAGLSELGMKMMDTNLTPEQRQAITDQLTDQKNQSDATIRKFLNNQDDYNTYKGWQDTQAERMQVQLGESAFEQAGAPLSDEQREQLINLMANVRKSSSSATGPDAPPNMSPENMTPDAIARQMERYDANASSVLQQSPNFLSPPQVDALKKMQEQMRAMMEAGLKMSAQMFGAGKK